MRVGGFHRYHAILGASAHCIATHPSDMASRWPRSTRWCIWREAAARDRSPLTDLHRLPGERPDIETVLEPGELITAIELPPLPLARNSTYRKVRDRASYAFALISVAAALEVEGRSRHRCSACARRRRAQAVARDEGRSRADRPARDEASFLAAADAELADAVPLPLNAFKIELRRRTIAAVLGELAHASEARA